MTLIYMKLGKSFVLGQSKGFIINFILGEDFRIGKSSPQIVLLLHNIQHKNHMEKQQKNRLK